MKTNDSGPIVELITIGREILDGRVLDSNSSHLGEKLNRMGLCPRWAQRVDDDLDRIIEAFEIAQKRSQIVLCTGGLGPTSDDLTNEAFAKFSKTPYTLNSDALKIVEKAFERMKRPMTQIQVKQAYMAEIALPLENPCGTAPGVKASYKNCTWYFMPGVPREMKAIFENIQKDFPLTAKTQLWTWKTQFTSEGELQERIQKHVGATPHNIELCFRTRSPENHVSILCQSKNQEDEQEFRLFQQKLSSILDQDSYYSGPLDPSPELEEEVLRLAKLKKYQLAFVESCTGGLNAHRLTSISGASEAFWGSFVCYNNQMKEDLGVASEILQQHGAVSEECAEAMALSGAKKLKAAGLEKFLVVSTTGIKGPSGGSAEKPVGLCHLALANEEMQIKERLEYRARPGLLREDYKKFFSQKALDLVWKFLKN